MNLSNIEYLSRLSNVIQIIAIILVIIGALLAATKLFIDNKINKMKKDAVETERQTSRETISNLKTTITQQAHKIEGQSVQIETQKNKIIDIESKTRNRSFPKDKIYTIQKELSQNKGEKVMVLCAMGDQEAYDFAFQFMKIFQNAGWNIKEVIRAMNPPVPMKGIFLIFKSESEKKKYEYFINRLKSIGFNSVIQFDSGLNVNMQIIIGAKK